MTLTNISDFIQTSTNKDKIAPISSELRAVLQQIADDVVARLGFMAAVVATLENGHILTLRTYAVGVTPERLGEIHNTIDLSPIRPGANVSLFERKHQHNLGVRTVKAAQNQPTTCLISDSLYDLLCPLVDHKKAEQIQEIFKIRQVIALPFKLDDEVVGCLLAAKTSLILQTDVDFLTAYAHQAATAIQSYYYLMTMQALQNVTIRLQSKITDETEVLQAIVDAVVQDLGYAGAIVATMEAGNALPVRAYAVDIPLSLLQQLEKRAGVSLLGPKAVVFLDDEKYKDNLSVRAVKGGENGRPHQYLISTKLYDLFRPVIQRPIADLAQRVIGIKQVIAVPFFLEGATVGNLFVATRRNTFTEREISVLTAFAQQAAVGIRNARLYHEAEQQRQIAQMFGRMAFGATASIHTLRNHIGAVRTYMHLLEMMPRIPPEQYQEILDEVPSLLERLDAISELLDNLHEPWQHTNDEQVDINHCLSRALRNIFPGLPVSAGEDNIELPGGITLYLSLQDHLPAVYTSPGMLTEAFKILIKNAVEAIQENKRDGVLWIASEQKEDGILAITIRDNGVGIPPENLSRIFELGWSTKQGRGMGFGLFWTKDYVQGLGGQIRVESVPRKGTTFYITIPPAKAILDPH